MENREVTENRGNPMLQALLAPNRYELTESLFVRVLGLIYVSSFASFWPQMLGLFGSRGIVPLAPALASFSSQSGSRAFWSVPSLFLFSASDSVLQLTCALGCIAAALMCLGIFTRSATIVCWILYLTITAAGQPFTGFQWDALLLECGFLAIFAGAPWLVWAYRFLLFRLMFESGAVKLLSHDPNWRNLHALRFHFLTQPLPNPLAYYAYRAPTWMLDAMTAATICIELLVPFFFFTPFKVRRIAAALTILLQICIMLTGNYAFFNLLTIALCLWLFRDVSFDSLRNVLAWKWPKLGAAGMRLRMQWPAVANIAVAVIIALASVQTLDMFAPTAMLARAPMRAIAPFEIVNTYGLFAVMTTTRREIVLEGSNDLKTWSEYSFPFKPGNLHRGLPVVAPYQPRLDWQMWFAALGVIQENQWVGNLIYRIMVGSPAVLGLLDSPPFGKPPHYMRAVIYEYTFTTPAERSKTGAVWRRTALGPWYGPVSLISE